MSADPQESFILSEVHEQVMTLRITRPERKNALNLAMYDSLSQNLQRAEQDPNIRVTVLAGSAGCFTSGNDLQDFAQGTTWDASSPVLQFMRTLAGCQKPVVVAVEGVAVGIGTTLLLHCDLIYAHPEASFQLPFIQLGLCPEFASSLLLAQVVGATRAREWLLTGKAFGAQEAFDAGLVNALVPDSLAAAQAAARHLALLPPQALANTKALLKENQAEQVKSVMVREEALFAQALQGAEFAEAASAFFEKRPADFSRCQQPHSGE